jgi:hypothetical protein
MNTLHKLRDAVANKSAKLLTTEIAYQLKGKRIATIYFGYDGQDGIDEFFIGEIKPEIHVNGKEGHICIFTTDGRNTFIRALKENEGIFTCSDSDRFVYFIKVK